MSNESNDGGLEEIVSLPGPTTETATILENDFIPTTDLAKTKERNPDRELTARLVAFGLIRTFQGALIATFLIIIVLLILAMRWPKAIMLNAVPMVDTFSRLIQCVGSLLTPLLAFILGYYFKESVHAQHQDEKKHSK